MEFSMELVNKYIDSLEKKEERISKFLQESGRSLAKEVWISPNDLFSIIDDFAIMPVLLKALELGIKEVKTDMMSFNIFANRELVTIVTTDSVRNLFDEESREKFLDKYYSSVGFCFRIGSVKSVHFSISDYFKKAEHGIVEYNGFFLADEIDAFLKEFKNALLLGIEEYIASHEKAYYQL